MKQKVTHTPGPWRLAHEAEYGNPEMAKRNVVDLPTWRVLSPVDSKEEHEIGDAALIATAPELLAALQRAIEVIDLECDAHETVQELRAVVEKATHLDEDEYYFE